MTKFRTQYDLQDFADNEVYEEGTSETEEGQEANVRELYQRCLRGEMPSLYAGDYDIKGDMDLEDAFDTLDPTQREGFDLADASAYADYLQSKLSSGKEDAEAEQAVAHLKADSERLSKADSEATSDSK